VNVLHLTDSHIQRDPDTVHKGLDPRLSLQAVVKDACEQDWQADLVLLTGDMSHDGSIESYEFLRDVMQGLPQAPVYHLPGNHDQADVMREGEQVHSSSISSLKRFKDDVKEVLNYVAALEHGVERLKELPISLRLFKEIHADTLSVCNSTMGRRTLGETTDSGSPESH